VYKIKKLRSSREPAKGCRAINKKRMLIPLTLEGGRVKTLRCTTLVLIFSFKDGRNMFLRKSDIHLPYYKASEPTLVRSDSNWVPPRISVTQWRCVYLIDLNVLVVAYVDVVHRNTGSYVVQNCALSRNMSQLAPRCALICEGSAVC
jgi:hypothetical protein